LLLPFTGDSIWIQFPRESMGQLNFIAGPAFLRTEAQLPMSATTLYQSVTEQALLRLNVVWGKGWSLSN